MNERRARFRSVASDEVDELIARGREELDPTTRHSIYRRIEEIIAQDVLLLPLFNEQVYRFVRREIEGVELSYWIPAVAYEKLGFRR